MPNEQATVSEEVKTLMRQLLAVNQTAYANAHNGAGKGVMESDAIAVECAARLLSSALRAERERVRRETLEEAAQVIDQCNREGPYNAICGAERIRLLADNHAGAEK